MCIFVYICTHVCIYMHIPVHICLDILAEKENFGI